jgi:hypothetical protein
VAVEVVETLLEELELTHHLAHLWYVVAAAVEPRTVVQVLLVMRELTPVVVVLLEVR